VARRDNAYSRVIAWLKLLLPLAALALLSTLFLVARTIDPTRAIPTAEVDVADLARDPRVRAPDYTGVTADGGALRVVAETAWPDLDGQARMAARVVRGELVTPDGARYEMTALEGVIDAEAGRVVLDGDVVVSLPAGYTVRSARIETSLDASRLVSPGPVAMEGPIGQLSAGAMEARAEVVGATDGDRRHVVVFTGGVKLIYDPEPGE